MRTEILLISAMTIGAVHALAPDHWLPFVMLGKAQKWSCRKLTSITFLAGVGHVASSLLIAIVGISLGLAAENINLWESRRGNMAALLLIGFGLAYMLWGIKKWGTKHSHPFETAKNISRWTVFALVVFGPCEPLIPLILAGSAFGWVNAALVAGLFAFTTIAMMLLQVHLAIQGLSLIHSHRLEHASDIVAGAVIALTGVGICVMGL